MRPYLIVFALLVVLIACYLISVQRKRSAALSTYWSRNCTGQSWANTFPYASTSSIRYFLFMVADSFGLPRARALKLEPDDQVFGLYRACNPDPTGPDSLELETLRQSLCECYGESKFREIPDNVTFGDLFRRAGGSRPNTSLERTRYE